MKLRIIALITGIICLIYGLLVASVGSGTGFFLVWLAAGALLIFIFAASKAGLIRRLPAAVPIAFYAIAGAFAVAFLVFVISVVPHFNDRGRDDLDYIIVLGAQVGESGPSPVLGFRLQTALDYLEKNPNTKCIVSGGKGRNEPRAEALVMRDWLCDRGIMPERILVEDNSRNTIQNIHNSMGLMTSSGAKVGIVTNNFHINRALKIAENQGLTDVCGIAAGSSSLFLPNNLLREFLGTIKDLIVGNM